jgi:hypothetical protein
VLVPDQMISIHIELSFKNKIKAQITADTWTI